MSFRFPIGTKVTFKRYWSYRPEHLIIKGYILSFVDVGDKEPLVRIAMGTPYPIALIDPLIDGEFTLDPVQFTSFERLVLFGVDE